MPSPRTAWNVACEHSDSAITPPCTSPNGCLTLSSAGKRPRATSSVTSSVSNPSVPSSDRSTGMTKGSSTATRRRLTFRPAVATLDQLPPEQRAIIELVVQRERSYEDLAAMLDIPPPRVRQLARDALIELAPVSARRVADDRRGQLADYVLGQQSGAEREATRAHLRRSEAG